MDRLTRPFVACGLGLLMASAGCRATHSEVPPGRPFDKDGQQRKAIEFSSDGHPTNAAATNNFLPNNAGSSSLGVGIGSGSSRPNASAYGAPPGAYGPPGTAGAAEPPNLNDPATSRASLPPSGMPPLDSPPAGAPPSPDLNVTPSRGAVPNQTPADMPPGVMATPDQMPAPN